MTQLKILVCILLPQIQQKAIYEDGYCNKEMKTRDVIFIMSIYFNMNSLAQYNLGDYVQHMEGYTPFLTLIDDYLQDWWNTNKNRRYQYDKVL